MQKELLIKLGNDIKRLRLLKNLDRKTLCDQANISMNALRHLENGSGATVKTLVSVLVVLDKSCWLDSLSPIPSINPLDKRLNRKRASRIGIKEKSDLAHRASGLKKYDLTVEDFVKIHKLQNGKCGNPGCNMDLDLKSSKTHVDHNHKNGRVRSLMCSGCNTALGLLKENIERANGLAQYIKKHS